MGETGAGVAFFDREERIRRFGIDCGDELLWGHGTWSPGGEYCKTLVVKNVGKETIKMKYKPPATSIFSMDFPQVVTLSPGMSMMVQVVFRPVRVEAYDDYIEFVLKNKKLKWSFFIPIRARLSRVSVSVPEHVDFGFSPIMEKVVKTFEVQNTGQVPVKFEWQTKAPFTIEPSSGEIVTSQMFTASFVPVDPSVIVSKALFFVEGLKESPILFKMSGIGKYPFVTLSEERVDFGACRPGETMEKEIVLRNQSFVPAKFEITRVESDLIPVHTVHPTKGVIEPGQLVPLRIVFHPRAIGQFSCDNFCISTPGGNSTNLECVGLCEGPEIIAGDYTKDRDDVRFVQFGETQIATGGSEDDQIIFPRRVLRLFNKSNKPVRYQFLVDPDAEFEFIDGSFQGFIPGQLEKAVTVRFKPRRPGNYYERVFCVIQDNLPAYFDLAGTAFSGGESGMKNRPQQLLERHIVTQRRRAMIGLDRETPERLMELQDEGKEIIDETMAFPEDNKDRTCSGGTTYGRVEVANQMFKLPSDMSNVISVNMDEIDFGGASSHRPSTKRILKVTNKHHNKVVCGWVVHWNKKNSHDNTNNNGEGRTPFAIFPESQDIGPGQTVEFRVLFQPHSDNNYFGATASAFVHIKSNRSFRLVNDRAFIPPWHLSVRLLGHTFMPGSEHFLPKVNFEVHDALHSASSSSSQEGEEATVNAYEHHVEFPVCHLGETVFQNVVLENIGDTPVHFSFNQDQSNRFHVFPRSGLIQRNQFQIVSFRSNPLEEGEHQFPFQCMLNNSKENTHTIHLSSYCSLPKTVFCEPQAMQTSAVTTSIRGSVEIAKDEMFIKPTCLGLTTRRTYKIKNTSRVPLAFEWRIPKRFRPVLSVTPSSGRLRGNETATVEWIFAPKAARRYVIDSVLFTRSISDWNNIRQEDRKVLRIVAEGDNSFVTLSENSLDMGAILTSGTSQKRFSISNHADCDVQFHLVTTRSQDSGIPCEIELSQEDGILPSHSSIDIVVTTRPDKYGSYEFSVGCQCIELHEGQEDEAKTNGIELACKVFGSAANPTLAFEDARSSNNSTGTIWKQFDLERLNDLLKYPPTDNELEFVRSSDVKPEEDDENSPRNKLENVAFRFLPSLYGSQPQAIALQIRNVGRLPAKFRFRFPGDSDIEVEPWADSRVPSPKQIREAYLMDHRVFEITPREGMLGPGEATTLRLTYKYNSLKYDGKHELDVVLSLLNGRQIRLTLKGHTVAPSKPCLFPFSLVHQLPDTRIGLREPPVHEIQLYNPCPSAVEYFVDTNAIQSLCEENYSFPVLKCLNPVGVIEGGQTYPTALQFVFNPLESKDYSCQVTIRTRSIEHQTNVKPGKSNNNLIMEEPEQTADQERLEETKEMQQLTADACLDGFETTTITIHGRGHHIGKDQGICDSATNHEKPPLHQILAQPGQISSLSTDKVIFGPLIVDSVTTRVCFIRNLAASKLYFAWDASHPLVQSRTVRIEPMHGDIEPGSFMLCKFTVCADAPQVINFDVRCETRLGTRNGSTDGGSTMDLTNQTRGNSRAESRASIFRNQRGSPTKKKKNKNGTSADGSQHQSVISRSTASRDIRMQEIEFQKQLKQPSFSSEDPSLMERGEFGNDSMNQASPQQPQQQQLSSGATRSQYSVQDSIVTASTAEGSSENVKQLLFMNIQALILKQVDMVEPREKYNCPPQVREDDVNGMIDPNYIDGDEFTGALDPASGTVTPSSKRKESISKADDEFLNEVLSTIVKDKTVVSTLKQLPHAETPLFVDFLGSGKDEDDERVEGDRSKRNAQRALQQQRRNKMLQLAECQTLVSNVLENTLSNLIQETAHGEIDISTYREYLFPVQPEDNN